MNGTNATPPIKTNKNFQMRTPAIKNITKPLNAIMPAVPKSGCFKTNATGIKTRNIGMKR